MAESLTNIDYKAHLEHVLSVNEAQQVTIQNLQLQLLQLKKLIYGSRRKFLGAADQNAPTLFDVPAIAEVITGAATTVTYQKGSKHLQPNHKGRNCLPELCAGKNEYFILQE